MSSAPTLFTYYGCGLSLYGKRDFDRETGTYIKTHCFTLVYFPIFSIGAYRVADANEGGWYFLGKESLSGLAKGWSAIVALSILALIGGIVWEQHTNSPEYRANHIITEAQEAKDHGDSLYPARISSRIFQQNLPRQDDARAIILENLNALLASNTPQDGVDALSFIRSLPRSVGTPDTLFPKLPDTIRAKLDNWKSSQPGVAVQYLNIAQKIYPDNATLEADREPLIEAWYKAEPDNLKAATALARLKEATGDHQMIIDVLTPHKEALGSTDGARMLGQSLVALGQYNEAYDLLFPYVEKNLKSLSEIEEKLNKYTEQRWDHWLNFLQEGKASQGFYNNYDKASEEQQIDMVNQFVWKRIESEAAYKRMSKRYQEAAQVVPVALELGIVHLNRAQGFTDPTQREEELTRAENTFLTIKNVAGESDEYKLFLGQVKYWLGKKDEGKSLFEELLATNPDNVYLAVNVSSTLRDLGDREWARSIVENAYSNATSDEDRQLAAHQRAFLQKDEDDRIKWLERADTTATMVRIELNSAKGSRALQKGDQKQATQFLKKAILAMEEQPVGAARNNNLALVYFNLFEASGNLSHYKKGTKLMKEAILLEPGDAILLGNTVNTLMQSALMEVGDQKYEIEQSQGLGSGNYYGYLYNGQTEKDDVIKKWNSLEDIKAALAYSEKLMLLAPESPSTFEQCSSLYYYSDSLDHMKRLANKLKETDIDHSSSKRTKEEVKAGKHDADIATSLRMSIKKIEAKLQETDPQTSPELYAYLTTELANLELGLYRVGQNPSASVIIKHAETGWNLDPTASSETAYVASLMMGIHEDLIEQSKGYAKLAEKTHRVLGPSELITWTLSDGDPSDAAIIRKHKFYPKIMELELDSQTRYPRSPSGEEWALFQKANPDVATEIADRYKSNEMLQYLNSISTGISQYSESSVLDHYWTLQMLGESTEAIKVLEAGRNRGLLLPPKEK
ncbi:hypothetical protein [Rubellicoccus peritrichatus]|uniref:Tetratricopeptide repeat protein n=1 Tax=Rubellicoccus peritrichatus TaxID=3080537 RepID=A0AAQ3QY20_9BACT|nr:hypothetical protein [Puniceicoccus sp. CR14]WOO43637.1 hypothetical protein RZN69_11105 [Puniceicoccus sp. CR14]